MLPLVLFCCMPNQQKSELESVSQDLHSIM